MQHPQVQEGSLEIANLIEEHRAGHQIVHPKPLDHLGVLVELDEAKCLRETVGLLPGSQSGAHQTSGLGTAPERAEALNALHQKRPGRTGRVRELGVRFLEAPCRK